MNTRSKRASSVGMLLGFCVLAPPAPDSTLSQGDRQHIVWSYSGIAAAGVTVAESVVELTVPAESRTITVSAESRTFTVAAEGRTISVQDE